MAKFERYPGGAKRVWMSTQLYNKFSTVADEISWGIWKAQRDYPSAKVSSTRDDEVRQIKDNGKVRIILTFKSDADEAEFIIQNHE